MLNEWTVDTWVLYEAAKGECEIIDMLFFIRTLKHNIVLDHEKHILSEYNRCLDRILRDNKTYTSNYFVQNWIKIINEKKRVSFYSNQLSKKSRAKLLEMKFDRSDWPFVGACARSNGKALIAEESDYTQEIVSYLKSNLKIKVLKVQDCLKIFEP